MIAPPEPSALIGRGEQRRDLRTRQEVNLGSCELLAGYGQYALDLRGVSRCFERGIPKEGVDCGEAQITAACTQLPVFFQVVEEPNDQRRVDRLQRKPCRRRVQLLLSEL